MKGAPDFEWTRPADPALLRFLIRRHKSLLLGWACSWALLFPLLQFFHDPWGLAVAGGLFALFAGPALGAAEVMEGSEEFFLSLPLPKRTFFSTRYLLGLLSLLLLLCAGLALFQWNLPQKAWSLVVETGFTEPYPPPRTIAPAGALIIPFSLYTIHLPSWRGPSSRPPTPRGTPCWPDASRRRSWQGAASTWNTCSSPPRTDGGPRDGFP